MLIEKKSVLAMIKREQARQEREWNGRGDHPEIRCEGCKEKITGREDPETLEISQTKRGSLLVWHTACAGKVWDSKI